MVYRSLLLIIMCMHLSACVSVVAVGAAGTAAASASDRRTVGTQIDDKTTRGRVASAIDRVRGIDENASIRVHVYNGQVLLTGQTNQQALLDAATAAAESVEHVDKVHNQIRLGQPLPASVTMNDVWISTKVRTLISSNEQAPILKMDLIVENSEVFIMGRLTREEATAAVEVARNVKGVRKVIRVMELIN